MGASAWGLARRGHFTTMVHTSDILVVQIIFLSENFLKTFNFHFQEK